MMPILIPGPKQSGNDIDVYLRPLIEELLLLWREEGVRMWDEYKHEDFNLRALLFVTINDWPALSNLSGQSNKGYRACTHCLEDTDSIWLTHCRKVCIHGSSSVSSHQPFGTKEGQAFQRTSEPPNKTDTP